MSFPRSRRSLEILRSPKVLRDFTEHHGVPRAMRGASATAIFSESPGVSPLLHTATATPANILGTQQNNRTDQHLQKRSFRSLNLSPKIQRALDEVFQYPEASAVQQAVLPALLSQKDGTVTNDGAQNMSSSATPPRSATPPDAVIRGHTGSGKTLCFLIPAIEGILQKERTMNVPPGVKGLIVAPSRELALQIQKEAQTLLTFHGEHKVISLIGGVPRNTDTNLIKRVRPTLIVATPGRLIDHFESTVGFHKLFAHLQVLVLDEVDRFCEMGFSDAIKTLIHYLPKTHRNLFFSATIPHTVHDIMTKHCRANAIYIDCGRIKEGVEELKAQGRDRGGERLSEEACGRGGIEEAHADDSEFGGLGKNKNHVNARANNSSGRNYNGSSTGLSRGSGSGDTMSGSGSGDPNHDGESVAKPLHTLLQQMDRERLLKGDARKLRTESSQKENVQNSFENAQNDNYSISPISVLKDLEMEQSLGGGNGDPSLLDQMQENLKT
jgi:hypothetical protein